MTLLLPAVLALLVSIALTPVVARLGRTLNIVDHPGGRRIHRRITPRLGGVAIIATFFLVFLVYLPDIAPHFKPKQLAGFSLAAGLLLVVGVIDDWRGVPAGWQLASHIAAGLLLVVVGMGIESISSPFGGTLPLDQLKLALPIGGVDHFLSLPADLLTVLWVVLVINAINWLDGLDGLATGVGAISAVTLALLSLSVVVGQPHVALLALILAGSLLGFLLFNFHPARIFLGTAGSTFIGFTLATLAIISGGKIATAVLVLGFPILDALVVIIRRGAAGVPPWQADAQHLHHQLLTRGFSVRRTALTIYVLSAVFGGLALLAGTTSLKFLAFGGLVVLMVGVLAWLASTSPTKAR